MMAAHSNQWASGPVVQSAAPQEGNGYDGMQTRPMGLKVQYTFDKEGKMNCLARWQHILQIQTMSLDDKNTIGVVDLRTCLQAVAQCSPELVNQQDHDYTVYAMDYSEPDVPLVGQGMLSWGLEQHNTPEPQLVTGRVTRNMMALFGNGNKETLEVKLKLTSVPKLQRQDSTSMSRPIERPNSSMSHRSHQHHHHRRSESQQTRSFHQPQPQMEVNGEWSSFMQSNPTMGHTSNVTPVPSPVPQQAGLFKPQSEQSFSEMQHNNNVHLPHQQHQQQHHHSHGHPHLQHDQQPQQCGTPNSVPDNFTASFDETFSQLPTLPQQQPELPQLPPQSYQSQSQNQPLPPIPTSDIGAPEKPKRVRNRTGPPKPRGRPRKNKPADAGHTSGAEMTDADEGPQPKRAKVVQTHYNTTAAFQTQPDSLRVAASISGSLRNMRPVGATGNSVAGAGSHLQDIPRAPTPVPNGLEQPRRGRDIAPRRPSMADFEAYQQQMEASHSRSQFGFQSMNQHDARSPTESIQSPDAPEGAYTPEQDSPADIGSSPPVPRTSAFIQSSSAPSSPVLPPADSGFMSGGMDDYLEDDDVGQDLPKRNDQQDLPTLPEAKPKRKYTRRAPRRGASQAQMTSDNFQLEEPGPPHLLPTTSDMSNLKGRGASLNEATGPVPFYPKGPPPPRELTPRPAKVGGNRRTNSTASVRRNPLPADQHPHTLAAFEVAVQSVEMPDSQPPSQPSHANPYQPQQQQQQNAVNPGETGDMTAASHFNQHQIQRPESQTKDVKTETEPVVPIRETVEMVPTVEPAQVAPPQQLRQDTLEAAPAQSNLQSTGAVSLTLPQPALALISAPSPEPELPTSLPSLSLPPPPKTTTLTLPPVPASDPVHEPSLALPTFPPVSHSDAPCPPSDAGEPYDYKARKTAVKGRLEQALEKGEMPPFCSNCGAIETPTWRKIWCQDHHGVPAFHDHSDYSDKPGMVTTIDILEKDADGKPTMYRLVKKNLGKSDSKAEWSEQLLCNPCGIWLSKSKRHRPSDRWEKDASRLGASRKRRDRGESKEPKQRNKRVRTKSSGQMNPTSEAYLMTDPAGPGDSVGPEERQDYETDGRSRRQSTVNTEAAPECSQGPPTWPPSQHGHPSMAQSFGSNDQCVPGSTHSRGSGTAQSPIALEEDDDKDIVSNENIMGATRRLLFPSPRKDGTPKVLGELAVNVVTTTVHFPPQQLQPKAKASDKENAAPTAGRRREAATPEPTAADDDDAELDQELFGTPPTAERPSTPPPQKSTAKHGPFKTPTRPTPSHRPITRSVSRSIRSGQKTPTTQALFAALQRTPTPRSNRTAMMMSPSAMLFTNPNKSSRTPRNNHHAHFADMSHLDTPFTATLNQLLSEANEFTSGSPSHGLVGMDLGNLPNLDSEEMARLAAAENMDFGHFLNSAAEMGLPSSPPMLGGHGKQMNFASMLDHQQGDEDMWARYAQGHESVLEQEGEIMM